MPLWPDRALSSSHSRSKKCLFVMTKADCFMEPFSFSYLPSFSVATMAFSSREANKA